MKLLVAQGLTKRFGGIVANKSVSFDIEPGEVHAVIGPNGAGKSTFMSQLSGEHLPDEGSIVFDGHDVTKLPIYRRARLGLGRCYQVSRVFLDHSTIENIAIGVLARLGGHLRSWGDARADQALLGPASRILDDVGLSGREHVEASALSHGERRQLELAMALATKPSLLLLDEPMAGMGVTESRIIIDLIAKLATTIAVVLIEHDMEAVMALAKRISVLVNGQMIATGSPEDIVANPLVQDAYLSVDTMTHAHA
jgi:branched-chain amino acid transport system ATP-binding protein